MSGQLVVSVNGARTRLTPVATVRRAYSVPTNAQVADHVNRVPRARWEASHGDCPWCAS